MELLMGVWQRLQSQFCLIMFQLHPLFIQRTQPFLEELLNKLTFRLQGQIVSLTIQLPEMEKQFLRKLSIQTSALGRQSFWWEPKYKLSFFRRIDCCPKLIILRYTFNRDFTFISIFTRPLNIHTVYH